MLTCVVLTKCSVRQRRERSVWLRMEFKNLSYQLHREAYGNANHLYFKQNIWLVCVEVGGAGRWFTENAEHVVLGLLPPRHILGH